MKIGYLINQYPKVSHSFIRREILQLEALGVVIERFAIRTCEPELVDQADQLELAKTQVITHAGLSTLLIGLLHALLWQPRRFIQAVCLTFKMGWNSDRGLLRHLAYLLEACILKHWCITREVGHIHAHFGTNSTAVAMLCQTLGGPSYSFTVHGPEEFDKPVAIALTEKIHRACFVVAVSSFGRSQLYRWSDPAHWAKIHVIHCGVDHLFLDHPQVQLPSNLGLVCVGRLSEQKGHLILIEAVKLLAERGLDFHLVLVGDGPLRQSIENLRDQYRLQRYLSLMGWASNEEVRQQILEARALVLPSFAEGLPVVLMEALALGRPVISTYIAGIPELVTPGVCGWLVAAGAVEALANAIAESLEWPVGSLEKMGRAGIERVVHQFNAEIEARKLARLFQEVE